MQRSLLYGGPIYTMAGGQPSRVEALLLCGERVAAAGRRRDLENCLGAGDRRLNLGGRTVLPGFIDAHVHLQWFSLQQTELDLSDAADLDAALARVADADRTLPPDRWLRGGGWDAGGWERWPTRWDLDNISPHRPVVLASRDFHTYWVNSRVLALAGITAATADPAGGRIGREPGGEPNGLLQETAQTLVNSVLPAQGPDEIAAALRTGIRMALAAGVTGVHDMDGVACFQALQRLDANGELPLRVVKYLPGSVLGAAAQTGLAAGYGGGHLRIGGLKLFSDGSLGSRTCAMLRDFDHYPGNRGVLIHTAAELQRLVATAAGAGLACAIHAIGDAANRLVLDTYAAQAAPRPLRQRIEHAQHLGPADVPRFGAQGVVASVQPAHLVLDRRVAERCLGPRCRWAYAFRSLLAAGACLAFGSDAPVAPVDPLGALYAAVYRCRGPGESPWYPEERLTIAEAVWAHTMGAALAGGTEQEQGTLEAGKWADLVVLNTDVLAGGEEALRTARVEATWVGGRPVYGGW